MANEINNALTEVGNFWNAINGTNSAMQKQQEYNTEMANTVYQRTVEDLKKAGLNPYMALSNGANSAEASSGLAHSHVGQGIGNTLSGIGNIINSAANMTRTMNDKNEIKPKLEMYNTTQNLLKKAENITSATKATDWKKSIIDNAYKNLKNGKLTQHEFDEIMKKNR